MPVRNAIYESEGRTFESFRARQSFSCKIGLLFSKKFGRYPKVAESILRRGLRRGSDSWEPRSATPHALIR